MQRLLLPHILFLYGLFLFLPVLSVAEESENMRNEVRSTFNEVRSNALMASQVAGREFYITFPPRYQASNQVRYRIFVTSSIRTRVSLDVEGKGLIMEKFTVPNDVLEFGLSSGTASVWQHTPQEGAPPEQIYRQSALHLKAGAPVVVYAFALYEDGGGDSFLALPINTLGKEYIVSSMPDMGWQYGNVSYPSEICVVAPYDNTRVIFVVGGNSTTKTAGGAAVGKSIPVTLNRGDVWVVATHKDSKEGDLSGSRIVSTKPIGLISGHQCANVPSSIGPCGYLAEMEIPTNMWGTVFYLPRYIQRTNAPMLKIVAKEANTKVFRNGTIWQTIEQVGGTIGKGVIEGRADTQSNGTTVITADKPISIMFFNPGGNDDGITTAPFQMVIFPTEQYTVQSMFNTPGLRGNKGTARNYLSIIYPLTANNTIPNDIEFGVSGGGKISWQPLATVFGASPGDVYSVKTKGTTYASKQCELPGDGMYHLRSSQPFMSYAYGSSDSLAYGHPLSAALTLISKDTLPPDPRWLAECNGRVLGASVTDLPTDINTRSNLSMIVLDPQLSKNYSLSYDDFIPGDAVSTQWSLQVDDLRNDATAVVTFTDRAGNDTTITVMYQAHWAGAQKDIDFGLTTKGTTIRRNALIQNNSTSDNTITRLELKNGGNGMFRIIGATLPFTLRPNETKEIEIEFSANASGYLIDSLGVGNDCVFLYSAELRARVAGPAIEVSDVNFGSVVVNDIKTKTFVVRNNGTEEAIITAATPPMPNNNVFSPESAVQSISALNPLVLKAKGTPGDSIVFKIDFRPLDKQKYQATITFSSNANGSDSICVINGEGTGVDAVDEDTPLAPISLEVPNPNPMGEQGGTVRFHLGYTMPATLELINTSGILITTLADGTLSEGQHSIPLQTSELPEGVYLLRLRTGNLSISKAFILLR